MLVEREAEELSLTYFWIVGTGIQLICAFIMFTLHFLCFPIFKIMNVYTMNKWSASESHSAAAAAKSLQSCPTLCDPIDGSPRGSPVPGILQARTLEWVAISFSNAGKWKVKVKSLSLVRLLATPWTAAHQAPPSMGFSRQEYWSGVKVTQLCPALCDLMDYTVHGILQARILEFSLSPGDLLNPGIGPRSLVIAARFFTTWAIWIKYKTILKICVQCYKWYKC